jgi:hypothetical protein
VECANDGGIVDIHIYEINYMKSTSFYEHVDKANDEDISNTHTDKLKSGSDFLELELKLTLKHKLITMQNKWNKQCISKTYKMRILIQIFGELGRREENHPLPSNEQIFGENFRRMLPT